MVGVSIPSGNVLWKFPYLIDSIDIAASPTGRYLAATIDGTNFGNKFAIIDALGEGMVLPEGDRDEMWGPPSWSSDGSMVAVRCASGIALFTREPI